MKLACSFLKLNKHEWPLCTSLFSLCQRWSLSLSILLLEPFIAFLQGVKEQDTSLISTPNNFTCFILQFYFCAIDSWSCAQFASWYYSTTFFVVSVFPSWPHYIYLFPIFVSCLALSTCKTFFDCCNKDYYTKVGGIEGLCTERVLTNTVGINVWSVWYKIFSVLVVVWNILITFDSPTKFWSEVK